MASPLMARQRGGIYFRPAWGRDRAGVVAWVALGRSIGRVNSPRARKWRRTIVFGICKTRVYLVVNFCGDANGASVIASRIVRLDHAQLCRYRRNFLARVCSRR